MTRRRWTRFSLALVLHLYQTLVPTTLATCECGFTLNTTTSPSSALFTDLQETDFLHTSSVVWNTTHSSGWIPQSYNVSAHAARGPYGKAAQVQNVVTNPLANMWDWGGQGSALGGDPGLRLYVRSELVPGDAGDQLVPMAEVVSQRSDVLFASVRVGMKTTAVAGTCAAAFWYRNDSAEIDAEFLSSQLNASSNPVNLVLQSPQSLAAGYAAAGTPGFVLQSLPFAPDQAFHEYRFDWLPDRVDFYADGMLLKTFLQDIPDGPGTVMLNHWSNGNAGWSGGPPRQDAFVSVSYVKVYFNSSDAARNEQYGLACGAGTSEGRTCVIPDQLTPPDPTGENGNVTGKTFFFEGSKGFDAVNQTIYPDAAPSVTTSGASGAKTTGKPNAATKVQTEWKGLFGFIGTVLLLMVV